METKTPVYTFDKERHRHLLDDQEIPGVTRILRAFGFGANAFYTEYGRDRGTFVHLATELYDRGELDEDTLDPVLAPYLAGYKAFRAELGAEPIHIEVPLCSVLRRFATVIDRVMTIGKKVRIVEIKGGAEEKHHRLQTAMQAHICRVNGIRFDGRAALYLSPDGSYRFRPHDDPGDEHAAMALVAAYSVIGNYGGAHENNDA